MEDDQLKVFSNLHVVNGEVNGVLGNALALTALVTKHSECLHSQLVPDL